jgi:hypothetical protein
MDSRRTAKILVTAALSLLLADEAWAPPGDPSQISTVAPTITRAELLRRVDTRLLERVHHIDPKILRTMDPRVFLDIISISPTEPKDDDVLTVSYTLTNLTLQQAKGTTTGMFQSHELIESSGSKPAAIDLAPGQSLTDTLRVSSPIQIGMSPLTLGYKDQVKCHQMPGPNFGALITVCTAGVTASASTEVSVIADPAKVDSDQDGIPDVVETLLLARFRPFYRFSIHSGDDETARPADVGWFVQHSELYDHHTETDGKPVLTIDQLSQTPSLLLTASTIGSARVSVSPKETSYYLNVYNNFRGGESDWNKIQGEATGLYGHVAPLRENPAAPTAITAYKIEYWQFYAYNPVPVQIDCYSISDSHEGDWEGVELIVELDQNTIRLVRHNIHSSSASFQLSTGTRVDIGGGFVEYRGPHASLTSSLPLDLWFDTSAGNDNEQNNLVRFFCNGDGCVHPVVYIEHGGHASWPTEHWTWPGVWNHDGDSPHAYLVATPPNLGEVGHPNSQCPGCVLAVEFNGHWGACGSDPPQGPTLHGSWGKP